MEPIDINPIMIKVMALIMYAGIMWMLATIIDRLDEINKNLKK